MMLVDEPDVNPSLSKSIGFHEYQPPGGKTKPIRNGLHSAKL